MYFEFLIIMFACDFHEANAIPFGIGMARNSLSYFHMISKGQEKCHFLAMAIGKVCLNSLLFLSFVF